MPATGPFRIEINLPNESNAGWPSFFSQTIPDHFRIIPLFSRATDPKINDLPHSSRFYYYCFFPLCSRDSNWASSIVLNISALHRVEKYTQIERRYFTDSARMSKQATIGGVRFGNAVLFAITQTNCGHLLIRCINTMSNKQQISASGTLEMSAEFSMTHRELAYFCA